MLRLLSSFASALLVMGGADQCGGGAPMTDLLYIQDLHYLLADRICCNNHDGAEPKGFFTRNVDFFSQVNPTQTTIFYDSVCGLPLFRAPVGRSFEAWKKESIDHGWPSFRPEETYFENVNVLPGGRMESVCGTHLGHNLPDYYGDRYCIDLVCMSGKPAQQEEATDTAVGNDDGEECSDAEVTNLVTPDNVMLSCTQLLPYCTHAEYGKLVTPVCPASCGLCEPEPVEPVCEDAVFTGFTNQFKIPLSCVELAGFCENEQYGAMIKTKCPLSCGECWSWSQDGFV